MIDTSILTALIGAVVLLGATWLGAYLNRKGAVETARQLIEVEHRKYAQSRLWDAKKAAYTEIVSQLNGVQKAVATIESTLFDPEIDPDYYLNSDESTKENTALWQRIRALWTTIDNNSLILSDEFQAAFAELNVEFIDYAEDDSSRGIVRVQSKAMSKYVPLIIKIAKSELEADPKSGQ